MEGTKNKQDSEIQDFLYLKTLISLGFEETNYLLQDVLRGQRATNSLLLELRDALALETQSNVTVTNSEPGDEDEATLFQKYKDIMGIVDNHPVFRKATLQVEKGGWGIFPQILTNKCKEYGVMAVLNGIRYVANKPSVKNPRAFFLHALEKGQFSSAKP